MMSRILDSQALLARYKHWSSLPFKQLWWAFLSLSPDCHLCFPMVGHPGNIYPGIAARKISGRQQRHVFVKEICFIAWCSSWAVSTVVLCLWLNLIEIFEKKKTQDSDLPHRCARPHQLVLPWVLTKCWIGRILKSCCFTNIIRKLWSGTRVCVVG